jgi:hypothetical protein
MIKCDKCKSNFLIGNRADGTPNGVGFQLQDGRIINLCADCISELGRLREKKDEAGTKAFFKEIGVEV